jgi:hypothetical protein
LRPPAKGKTQAQVRAQYGNSKQVKHNSEGGKKRVSVLLEPKLRNPNLQHVCQDDDFNHPFLTDSGRVTDWETGTRRVL